MLAGCGQSPFGGTATDHSLAIPDNHFPIKLLFGLFVHEVYSVAIFVVPTIKIYPKGQDRAMIEPPHFPALRHYPLKLVRPARICLDVSL